MLSHVGPLVFAVSAIPYLFSEYLIKKKHKQKTSLVDTSNLKHACKLDIIDTCYLLHVTCYLILSICYIFLSWKELIKMGIRDGLTPFLRKDSIPNFWGILSKAWVQLIIWRSTPIEFLESFSSTLVRILCTMFTR